MNDKMMGLIDVALQICIGVGIWYMIHVFLNSHITIVVQR